MNTDFKESLKFWWRAIKTDDRLIGSPPAPSFELVADPTLAVAQITLLEIPAIEVSAAFVGEMLAHLEENFSHVCASVLSGLEYDESDVETTNFVRKALVEQIISFVNLHELFHILSGHLRDLQNQSHSEIESLSEQTLGMANSSTMLRQEDIDESYYREFEADNCGLQSMVQLPMPVETIEFLSAVEVDNGFLTQSLIECEGVPKVIGFRLIGVATWLMVRLIESKRHSAIQATFDDHPLPEARLLSCLTTLQEEYASLSAEVVDGEIQRSIEPSEEQSRQIVDFSELVLKPMMLHLPAIQNAPDLPPVTLVDLAHDMARLMFGGELNTDAGREVLRLQSMREAMESRLSKLRYYE
ncbi:hypothetical protein [Roseiconus lacunae]|uniref:hypothetical protein n=1 Tax=Roseiconus lacunae TaxID=2605694 RepID=UPI001E53B9A1|nr:hypothetical protein [Roseiconus lacunae]MCD0463053.1 hypothetical protein [Roseiconus lacunae]